MVLRSLLFSLFLTQSAFALPSYKIDPQGVTISGVSSGAFMAVQMHVAYSRTISGVGSVAGGVYWCAQGSDQRAQVTCMSQPSGVQVSEQTNEAKRLETSGSIDPLSGLAHHPVYIYASPRDGVVNPAGSVKLREFYETYVDPSDIHVENSVPSAHGFPTVDKGNACNQGFLPWLLKCNYDGAGEILKAMYGSLDAKGCFDPSHLQKFSQVEFGSAQAALYDNGWIYVPASCAAGETCKLHVALHGCQMNPDFIQDRFEREVGFNEWAESNHIVVLYPQAAKLGRANPYGCWDWYGFTGKNYATQAGPQMAALKKMIDQVSGN